MFVYACMHATVAFTVYLSCGLLESFIFGVGLLLACHNSFIIVVAAYFDDFNSDIVLGYSDEFGVFNSLSKLINSKTYYAKLPFD